MPKTKVSGTWPELDRDSYIRDFKKAIDQSFIKAARKFLLAAVPRIPEFTGMARGALANLEDVAGKVSGTRIRGTRKGQTSNKSLRHPRKYYYYPPGKPRVLRTPQAGRQFATKPKDILKQGQLTKASVGARVIFKFVVDIRYFDILDEQKWHAFEAGRDAFNQELKVQLERLRPKAGKYLLRREIK